MGIVIRLGICLGLVVGLSSFSDELAFDRTPQSPFTAMSAGANKQVPDSTPTRSPVAGKPVSGEFQQDNSQRQSLNDSQATDDAKLFMASLLMEGAGQCVLSSSEFENWMHQDGECRQMAGEEIEGQSATACSAHSH